MFTSMPDALLEALAAGTARERKREWIKRACLYRNEGNDSGAFLCVRYAREQSREYVRCMLRARELHNVSQED